MNKREWQKVTSEEQDESDGNEGIKEYCHNRIIIGRKLITVENYFEVNNKRLEWFLRVS